MVQRELQKSRRGTVIHPKTAARRERDKSKNLPPPEQYLSPEVNFMPRKDPGMPYDLAPMLKARFGQPDDCADLVNKYGTYNIQPTSDTENLFPLIAPAPSCNMEAHGGRQEGR